MASGPITSWQIDGETMETVRDFIWGAPKSLQMVTAAMKLKRCLLLGGKVMTNLDSILNRCLRTGVLEKILESPLDSKEIHQSILKEISPKYSLEGLMLKLKLQYFGHLMRIADSFEKTLMLGKIEGRWSREDRG